MKNKAFTLVELLAVIAIVGITSTFVLINTNKKKEEYSKISNIKCDLKNKKDPNCYLFDNYLAIS